MNPTTSRAIATYIALSRMGVVHDEMINQAIHLILTVVIMDVREYNEALTDVIEVLEGAKSNPPPKEAVEELNACISVNTGGGHVIEVNRAFVRDGVVDMELLKRTMSEPKGQA